MRASAVCSGEDPEQRWWWKTVQQTKWVCLPVNKPVDVVASSPACDIRPGWSCQTKPVKCKTNLPINLSESSRGPWRWYNWAWHYRYFQFVCVFCFSRLRRPNFPVHFCSVLPVLSCFRLLRHADNGMKSRSCIGSCPHVYVCACRLKAWVYLMSNKL